jgi:flagellar motor switch protein FliM
MTQDAEQGMDETSAVDQEAMMAEWEKMAADDQGDAGGEPADEAIPQAMVQRALSQDEIDNLLGNFSSGKSEEDRDAIRRILQNANPRYGAWPILDQVFDRQVRLMTSVMRNMTGDSVEVWYEGGKSLRFSDYINQVNNPSMLAVFKAEQWGSGGLIMLDHSLVNGMVDVMLGGRNVPPVSRANEGRGYTLIERSLIEGLVREILDGLSKSFQPVMDAIEPGGTIQSGTPVEFKFERIETLARFAMVTRPQNAVRVDRLSIVMDKREGFVEIVFPYATLEPVAEVLGQQYMGEKLGRDSFWESHLKGELGRTNFDVTAILAEITYNLREIVDWVPGTVIGLPVRPTDTLPLFIANQEMFRVTMGTSNGHCAVRIVDGDTPTLADLFPGH